MYIKLKCVKGSIATSVLWSCHDLYSGGAIRNLNGVVEVKNASGNEIDSSEAMALFGIIHNHPQLREHVGIDGRMNISFSSNAQIESYQSKKFKLCRSLLTPGARIEDIDNDWVVNKPNSYLCISEKNFKEIIFRTNLHQQSIVISLTLLDDIKEKLGAHGIYPRSIIKTMDNNFNRQVLIDDENNKIFMRSIGITLKLDNVQEHKSAMQAIISNKRPSSTY